MSQPIANSESQAGARIEPSVITVFVAGMPIIVLNDKVIPHGPLSHMSGPRIKTSSLFVFAGGRPVTRQNDNASCGHRVRVGQKSVFAS